MIKRITEWLKKSLSHIWEGLMQNVGTAIAAFVASGGYLIAISKLGEFQDWVRSIPTDYVLTPLVLLVVLSVTLLNINRKQQRQLSRIEGQPRHIPDEEFRLVTHLGVWWKLYSDSDYIEDFPYCPCCNPPKKLVQTEWHPDEEYKCQVTGTAVKLYDEVPRKRSQVLESLHRAYFGGGRLHSELQREFMRLKELSPDQSEIELLRRVFKLSPFNKIPAGEVEEVLSKFQNAHAAISYFRRHYMTYRKYLRGSPNNG